MSSLSNFADWVLRLDNACVNKISNLQYVFYNKKLIFPNVIIIIYGVDSYLILSLSLSDLHISPIFIRTVNATKNNNFFMFLNLHSSNNYLFYKPNNKHCFLFLRYSTHHQLIIVSSTLFFKKEIILTRKKINYTVSNWTNNKFIHIQQIKL